MTATRTVDPQDPRTWPPMPPLPAHVQVRLDRLARADRALSHAMGTRTLAGSGVAAAVLDVCADLSATRTPAELAAEAAHDRAAEAHNALVSAYNAGLRAVAQTRTNAAEAAALRAGACLRCMATHPGEC